MPSKKKTRGFNNELETLSNWKKSEKNAKFQLAKRERWICGMLTQSMVVPFTSPAAFPSGARPPGPPPSPRGRYCRLVGSWRHSGGEREVTVVGKKKKWHETNCVKKGAKQKKRGIFCDGERVKKIFGKTFDALR
jgi:hypothetical protein